MLCGKWFYNTWELWWRYDFYNELVNIYVLFSHFFAISTVTELYIYSLLGAFNFDRLCRCIMPCSADDDVNFSFYMKKSILCQVVILFVFTIKYMVSFINGGGLLTINMQRILGIIHQAQSFLSHHWKLCLTMKSFVCTNDVEQPEF